MSKDSSIAIRNGIVCGIVAGQLLTVNRQYSGTALAWAGPVIFEVEHNRVLTRLESIPQPVAASNAAFPTKVLKVEKIVIEDRLTFEQVEAVAAEAATQSHNHPFGL